MLVGRRLISSQMHGRQYGHFIAMGGTQFSGHQLAASPPYSKLINFEALIDSGLRTQAMGFPAHSSRPNIGFRAVLNAIDNKDIKHLMFNFKLNEVGNFTVRVDAVDNNGAMDVGLAEISRNALPAELQTRMVSALQAKWDAPGENTGAAINDYLRFLGAVPMAGKVDGYKGGPSFVSESRLNGTSGGTR